MGTDDSELRWAAGRPEGARAAGSSHGRLRGCPGSLEVASMAGGDSVDGTALRFLVKKALDRQKEEEEQAKVKRQEEEKEERLCSGSTRRSPTTSRSPMRSTMPGSDGLSPTPPLHLPLGRGGRGRRGGRGASRSLPLVPLLVVDAPVLSSDMFQQSNMTVSLLQFIDDLDIPVVQQRQVRGLMDLKTVVVPQLQFIVGRRHSFRSAEAVLHGPVYSADHRDSPVAIRFQVVDVPVMRVVQFGLSLLPLVFGSHLFGVRCSLLEYRILDLWVITSGNVSVFSAYWFNTGYMSSSVYGGFWMIFTYFLCQGGPRIPKSMPGAVRPRISAQCMFRLRILAHASDYGTAENCGVSAVAVHQGR